MSFTPNLKHHGAQQYVALRAHLARTDLADLVPELLSEVYDWLEAHRVAAAGPPLIRYLV